MIIIRCLILLILLLLGCQSAPTNPFDVVLPAIMESYFTSCSNNDGAVNMQVYDGYKLSGSGDFEWSSKENGGWIGQLADPLGRTMLTIDFRGLNLKKSGRLAKALKDVTIGKDDFLAIDGHFIGVKFYEIPCFLKFSFPKAWLVFRTSFFYENTKGILIINDGNRKIKITNNVSSEEDQICAEITWKNYLIFTKHILICQTTIKNKSGRLSGIGDYSLRWVNLDD